jgi:Asp-tRNA(Asn)/Glu-tRNA(Gln) amidotransferase A subunit family amidase
MNEGLFMTASDLHELTIRQAIAGMAGGKFKSRDLAEALIARCEAGKALNAFVSTDWDGLRKAAEDIDGSGRAGQGLGGVPLCIKDNINTGILPAGAGTAALAGHVAAEPAPVATALFDAGALLGGTGNMDELAFGITSNNSVTGAAHNPWHVDRIPGGSSGGVAAAVAARMMPGGIGTDTGASVRLPASLCGLVGFRPTVGRYSGAGIVPISHTRDTAGPITVDVEDAILLDRVITGRAAARETVALNGLRIGVAREHFYEMLEPAVAEAAETALKALRLAGVELIEADIAGIGALDEAVSFPVALFEFLVDLQTYLDDNNTGLTLRDVCNGVGSPDVRGLFESLLGGGAVPEAAYRQVMDSARPKLQAAYRDYFARHNVEAIIFPTSPMTARPIGQDATVELNGEQVPTFGTYIRNVGPGSNAAIPGISLPVGLSAEGLPIGMELDGPQGSDDRLLAIAAAIEPVFSFRHRPTFASGL